MRIVVAGSGGGIGSALVYWLERDHEVICLQRQLSKASGRRGRVVIYQDLCNRWKYNKKADWVIYAAAQHEQSRIRPTAANMLKANALGPIRALEYCEHNEVKGIIYISTVEIHGKIAVPILREDTPIRDPGWYGATKYIGERSFEKAGLNSLTIRLPGVVGPNLLRNRPWVGRMLDALKKGEEINYFNGKALFNNIVDYRNICRFVEHVIGRSDMIPFDKVLLAARNPMPVRKAIEFMKRKIRSKSRCVDLGSRPPSFSIDNDRLIRSFGFKPDTTRQILDRFILGNLRLE